MRGEGQNSTPAGQSRQMLLEDLLKQLLDVLAGLKEEVLLLKAMFF